MGLAEEGKPLIDAPGGWWDADWCLGLSNLSGDRNAGNRASTAVHVTVDFIHRCVVYATKDGERRVDVRVVSSLLMVACDSVLA